MTATDQWEVVRGQSIDRTIALPADGPDPQHDGSWFVLALKAARADVDSVLVFDSRDPKRALTIEGWDAGQFLVTLSFRASRGETLAIPAGSYVGDLMHGRPRPQHNFGPKVSPIAAVSVVVL
ncbi:hypothetical protein [Methylocystis sp. S23]